MLKARRPLDVAIVALLFAIGIPCVVFMFGAIRTRQLQSKANPRWAQFAKVTGPLADSDAAKVEPARVPVRTASIRTETESDIESPRPAAPDSSLTGSATGRSSIELPVHVEPNQQSALALDPSNAERQPVDRRPATFRMVEDAEHLAHEAQTKLLPSTRRMESQLTDVHQRLEELAEQQQRFHVEDIQRNTQVFEALKAFHETLENKCLNARSTRENLSDDNAADPKDESMPVPFEPIPELPLAEAARPSHGNVDSIRIERQADADLFTMEAWNADVRQFLVKLSEKTGISILASADVSGQISLKLYAVPLDAALKAILKSRNYVLERDGDIVIISTADEAARLKLQNRKLFVRVYQPSHLSGTQFRHLIEPLLSRDGRQSVAPSSTSGSTQAANANVDDESNAREAVVVQDSVDVLEQIDRLLIEMDVPPREVEIEAKVLRVRLAGRLEAGVDMGQLPCRCERAVDGIGGMKQSCLACNVPTFIQSIKRLGETRVVNSQRIPVLNRHRAELLIGDRIGIQSKPGDAVQFAESAMRLVFRPTIAADGLIRIEIQPVRSGGVLDRQGNSPQKETVDVATEVLVHDGSTVAIGGLISEQLTDSPRRVSSAGTVSAEQTEINHRDVRVHRTETIILLTPHIVSDEPATGRGHAVESSIDRKSGHPREHEFAKPRQRSARSQSGAETR